MYGLIIRTDLILSTMELNTNLKCKEECVHQSTNDLALTGCLLLYDAACCVRESV